MASIASTVRDFKRDPEHVLSDELIRDAVSTAAHTWRDRLLGPVVTVRLMILQVLVGNVSGRASRGRTRGTAGPGELHRRVGGVVSRRADKLRVNLDRAGTDEPRVIKRAKDQYR